MAKLSRTKKPSRRSASCAITKGEKNRRLTGNPRRNHPNDHCGRRLKKMFKKTHTPLQKQRSCLRESHRSFEACDGKMRSRLWLNHCNNEMDGRIASAYPRRQAIFTWNP